MEIDLFDSAIRLLEDCDGLDDTNAEQYIDRECAGNSRLRALAFELMPTYREPIIDSNGASTRVNIDDTVAERYAIRRLISANDEREILVAEDRVFGDLVVLKGVTGLPKIDTLVRESHILRCLRHASIPRALDLLVVGRSAFLVMDFVDGVDLETELVRRLTAGLGPFDEYSVVTWAVSVLDVLEYLHNLPEPVVHRDLKPMNLVRRADGTIAILDFGVSKRFDGNTAGGGEPQPTVRGYTPGYAPMEQLVEGATTDSQTDLYALGATMYRLLSGHILMDSARRYLAVTNGEPDPQPRLDRIGLSVSHDVADIVAKAMSPRVSDRPDGAAQMRASLQKARTQAVKRARRVRASAGVAGGLLLLVIVVWYLVPARPNPRTERSLESSQHRPNSPDPGFEQAIGLEFVEVPAGAFEMGMYGVWGNESPMSHVTISRPFSLGKCEVTQAQWTAVMGTNPSAFRGDNLPVETVSWEDAKHYCDELGALTGYAYRLPTEAEWEYACGTSPGGPMEDTQDDLSGWYNVNSQGTTHPVGQKPPNRFGLFDLHGNVWEWCEDWYGYYTPEPKTDPTGLPTGLLKVSRGGSWSLGVASARTTNRNYNNPSGRSMDVGFRIVKIR